jgi:hypothetical protein
VAGHGRADLAHRNFVVMQIQGGAITPASVMAVATVLTEPVGSTVVNFVFLHREAVCGIHLSHHGRA